MKIVYIFLVIFLINACSTSIRKNTIENFGDGKYDLNFPHGAKPDILVPLVESVKLVSTIAFYESFEFAEDSKILKNNLTRSFAREKSKHTYHYNQPATGTATLVYYRNRKIALLTCAHIIDFPDSTIQYFLDRDGKNTKYIQKVAYKDRQNIHIIDAKFGGNFNLLAQDTERDIAIIGREISGTAPTMLPVFRFPTGKAEELEWGNFVYIIGYPRGEKMITSGLISNPRKDRYNSFTIDAVFNRGFSGGIIVAIRDGFPNLELVGMAKSVPAETNLYLKPDPDFRISESNINYPYAGEILVDSQENIFYGITYAVSIESIKSFLEQNKLRLAEKGYQLDYFFDRY